MDFTRPFLGIPSLPEHVPQAVVLVVMRGVPRRGPRRVFHDSSGLAS
jgi:hypothetical protein